MRISWIMVVLRMSLVQLGRKVSSSGSGGFSRVLGVYYRALSEGLFDGGG